MDGQQVRYMQSGALRHTRSNLHCRLFFSQI